MSNNHRIPPPLPPRRPTLPLAAGQGGQWPAPSQGLPAGYAMPPQMPPPGPYPPTPQRHPTYNHPPPNPQPPAALPTRPQTWYGPPAQHPPQPQAPPPGSHVAYGAPVGYAHPATPAPPTQGVASLPPQSSYAYQQAGNFVRGGATPTSPSLTELPAEPPHAQAASYRPPEVVSEPAQMNARGGTPTTQPYPAQVPYHPPAPRPQSVPGTQHDEIESLLHSLSLEGSWQDPAGGKQVVTSSQPHYPIQETAGPPAPPPPPIAPLQPTTRSPPQPTVPKQTPEIPNTKPPAEVITCLDFETTFLCTWRFYPSARQFLICPHCYDKSISGTPFADSFQTARLGDDGKSRICRFSKPRFKDVIWPQALSSGSLRAAVDWMRMRSEMGSCKGLEGVKGGGKGQTWYKVRDAEGGAAVPGFLVCGACYEDHVFVSPGFSSKFEPVPPGLYKADDIWACDFSLPYVKKVFEENSKTDNWRGFIPEVRARLGFPKCPGPNKGTTYQTAWFIPRDGPKGLMLCTACYCDQIIHSGEEDRWGQATEFIGQKAQARCAMGNVGMKICMAQGQEEKNLKIVWDALQKLTADSPADQPSLLQEELCKSGGEKDGVWYTLKNNPDQFGICKACCIFIAEPLGLGSFFELKKDAPADTTLLCCLNFKHPRGTAFFARLLESYVKADTRPLASWASIWARIPPCSKEVIMNGMAWYGWSECTICRECYHNFASKYPNMVNAMMIRDQVVNEGTMCEMYSPRMRKLYESVSASNPVNLAPLLEYSTQRRMVYAQTVPQIHGIIQQQKLNLERHKTMDIMTLHHSNKGWIERINFGDGPYLYSAPGVGSGFTNQDFLAAEGYRQQAMGIVSEGAGATAEVGFLEQRWRAAE